MNKGCAGSHVAIIARFRRPHPLGAPKSPVNSLETGYSCQSNGALFAVIVAGKHAKLGGMLAGLFSRWANGSRLLIVSALSAGIAVAQAPSEPPAAAPDKPATAPDKPATAPDKP